MTPPVVMLYVQHLLGIGHLKRALALAHGLKQSGARVVVASGGMPVPELDVAGLEFAQLPPARAADAAFSGIQDERGRAVDDAWKAKRRDALLAVYRRIRPDALIIEMYPFGRRPFRFELLPLLDATRAGPGRPLVATSVRDILVDKGRPERARETVDLVRARFDLVLVHGDPGLIRLDASFPLAGEIADRICYTGYVTEKPIQGEAAARHAGEVLVSAGGGAVGFPLLAAAIAAKPLSRLRDRPWRIIAGANLADREREALAAMAAQQPGVVLERFRADFTDLLRHCRVSVSQAGYNTVLEVLANRVPAVVVPFAEGSESEQTLRAQLLERRGLLQLVMPDRLTPERLAAAIDRAAAAEPPAVAVDLDGARHSAALILERLDTFAARSSATGGAP
jgi:predicted glycosyltransferase